MSEDYAFKSYVDPEKLKEDVAIDTADLTASMRTHAGLYTHYAVQAARASRQYDQWKELCSILEAQLSNQYRKSLAEEGGQRVTDSMVSAAVTADGRMRSARSKMLDAKQMKDLADSALLCFVHRKDMLLQMARDAAAERAGELRFSGAATSRATLLEGMAALKREAA